MSLPKLASTLTVSQKENTPPLTTIRPKHIADLTANFSFLFMIFKSKKVFQN